MATPIEEPELGYGRDIEIPLVDPVAPLLKAAGLTTVLGIVSSIGGGWMLPAAGGWVVLSIGVVLVGVGGFFGALAYVNRGRDDVVLKMDRAEISLPRVAIAGPRRVTLALTDLVADETWATKVGQKLVLKTRTAEVVLFQAQLAGRTSLDDVRKRVVCRAKLAQRQAGRVSRAVLAANEALAFLGAAYVAGVVVAKRDKKPIATVASTAEFVERRADFPDDAVLVVRDTPDDVLLAHVLDQPGDGETSSG